MYPHPPLLHRNAYLGTDVSDATLRNITARGHPTPHGTFSERGIAPEYFPQRTQPRMSERVKTSVGTVVAALDYDAELMLRVKEGDGASFGVLLEKHRTSVVHFLYRMVQNHGVAEELAQEVFLRVYRSRSTYEPTAKFTTWLFRIATHLALNSLRDGKHDRSQERLDDDSGDMPARQVSDSRPTLEQSIVYQARLEEIRGGIATLA